MVIRYDTDGQVVCLWHDGAHVAADGHHDPSVLAYCAGYAPPNYPVPMIVDNQTYLARELGSMSGVQWRMLWAWAQSEID